MGIALMLGFVLATASLAVPGAAAQDAGGSGSPPENWRESLEEHSRSESEPGRDDQGAEPATATTVLYLRFQPSVDATVLAVMPAGATVEIIGEPENGFVPLTYDGLSGYAAAALVSSGGGASAATGAAQVAAPGDGGGNVVSIIYAAAAAYGQSGDDMLRVATCESGLNPYAYNPAGWYGLFQFVPSTFASTPYAGYDIFDPWANANAAAWMWSVGRRGEWTCQ